MDNKHKNDKITIRKEQTHKAAHAAFCLPAICSPCLTLCIAPYLSPIRTAEMKVQHDSEVP